MQLPNELREVAECQGINLGEERRVQCQSRAAELLSVEEDWEGEHPHTHACSMHRHVLCSPGKGQARLALGEMDLCREGSRANQETGLGREGRLPV